MTIPSQGDTDFTKPEQHFLWAMRSLPWGDSPASIPRPMLERWSRHLVDTGAVHVSALWALADENGKIDINDLPKQKIKYLKPEQGQDHDLNGSGRWVPVNTPEPVRVISDTEAEMIKAELRKQGHL